MTNNTNENQTQQKTNEKNQGKIIDFLHCVTENFFCP